MLVREGLRLHSQEDFRKETLLGLEALWSPEHFAEYEGRLRGYWDAFDQFQTEHAGTDDAPDFEHPDAGAVDDLTRRVTASWRPLRDLAADLIAFNADSPTIMLSVLVDGWKHLDVPFAREEGVVTLDKLEDVEDALLAVEREAMERKIEGVSPSLAWLQLRAEAGARLFLSRTEEKNSASPSLSPPTPSISLTDGPEIPDGTSTASETSTSTPPA
ncbi:MAG: hypothetical protein DI547_04970 [Sphingobium sp.]|nr:MAG: hypothetical protein DI547_04970 [Sphingobium sp.]